MQLETVEDILDFAGVIEDNESRSTLTSCIRILASEVRDLKKVVTTQKLLIEHEENIRTAKSLKQPKPKVIFKDGDRVIRIKDFSRNSADKRLTGTVKKSNGRRTYVRFEPDNSVWVETRSLMHVPRKAS